VKILFEKSTKLQSLSKCVGSHVIFDDGGKGRIQGMSNVCSDELPKLENVLLVKGQVSNLISISQLCDQGMEVTFNKTECLVNNQKGEVLMKGTRSKNNCYKWILYQEDQIFERAKMLNSRLEHQKTFKVHNNPHIGYLNKRRRTFLEDNQIKVKSNPIRNFVEKKIIST